MSKNSVATIHDIKETSRRVVQFCCVAMVIASVTVITNVIYGNTLSALLVVGLIMTLAVLVWINLKGYVRAAKYGLVFTLNAFLIIIAFAEGLNSASTLYFLPLLYAIPFSIDNTKAYKQQVIAFFSVTLLCFAFCIIFCGKTSTWQPIAEETFRRMFIVNSICAFLLCAIFASLSIYLERKYVSALLEQINKTEEAMEARTKFLSNMGHELRTPLNGIIGATNLLRKGSALPEQREYLDILKYCSDHMLELVNDVLDFNKIEAGQLDIHPVECNIKKLLKQSTMPFYNHFEEKKLELRVVIDDTLDTLVLADDMRLVQVINNLLSNALKFTEKGYVLLEVKQVERKEAQVTISFMVQDTGIGISKQDQQKVFGSFWQVYNHTTRKYAGTGLGLTICQRLLRMMDAYLSVESEEGIGSKFYFTITVPVIDAKPEQSFMPDLAQEDLDGIKVLLAEDNIINAMIAKKILEEKDAFAVMANNGAEVLQILSSDSDFNLILLDLEMPVMDGYTAIVQIKKLYPQIPVVAFTAAMMDLDMYQNILDLGFKDYILKPFQMHDFYSKVKKYAKPVEALLASGT